MSDTGVVVFDFATWQSTFPELATVTPAQAGFYFDEATDIVSNTAASAVRDVGKRSRLYSNLVAHFAVLAQRNAAGGSGLVGSITNASEGSVSVAAKYEGEKSEAWWLQTTYGANALRVLRQSALSRPVLGRRTVFDPRWGAGRGSWRG